MKKNAGLGYLSGFIPSLWRCRILHCGEFGANGRIVRRKGKETGLG
jgi:hypothetical protein